MADTCGHAIVASCAEIGTLLPSSNECCALPPDGGVRALFLRDYVVCTSLTHAYASISSCESEASLLVTHVVVLAFSAKNTPNVVKSNTILSPLTPTFAMTIQEIDSGEREAAFHPHRCSRWRKNVVL